MNNLTTTTETGKQVKMSQVIVPEWLDTLVTDGGGDEALFTVVRESTGFGRFLVTVTPVPGAPKVTEPTCPVCESGNGDARTGHTLWACGWRNTPEGHNLTPVEGDPDTTVCPECGDLTWDDDFRFNMELGVVCENCNETELDCAAAGVPFRK